MRSNLVVIKQSAMCFIVLLTIEILGSYVPFILAPAEDCGCGPNRRPLSTSIDYLIINNFSFLPKIKIPNGLEYILSTPRSEKTYFVRGS